MAAHVSDRVTDEVMEALSKIQRVLANPNSGLDLSDMLVRPNTPDVLRPRGPTPTVLRRPIDTSPTVIINILIIEKITYRTRSKHLLN